MDGITFHQPQAAWALAALAVLIASARVVRRRHYAAIGTSPLLPRGMYGASRIRRLPMVIGIASLVAVVFALMDPVVPYSEERVESRGVDIVVVLDLSSSMEEMMGTASSALLGQTRLAVTKRVIGDFISRRPADRIGLVVFSDNAYVVSPMTVDHAYLQRYVAMIDERILRSEGMTAIGEGLTAANTLLARQATADTHRTRVIVTFTDGENNYGRDPLEALQDAHAAGHRVHLVGVDLEDEVKHKPEVLRLIRAVERGGGRYFTADTSGQLTGAARAIDAMETGVIVSSRSVRDTPAFAPFAAGALVLICAALLVRALPFFVDLT